MPCILDLIIGQNTIRDDVPMTKIHEHGRSCHHGPMLECHFFSKYELVSLTILAKAC